MKKLILILILLSIMNIKPVKSEKIIYPRTKKSDIKDSYFGKIISDPYRWLEDDNSDETALWVKEENKITFDYLNKIPFRNALKKRLEELYNYPKYSVPFKKGKYYFFSKNDGLQNQSVIYYQKGEGKPEVFIDPNTFSDDGTVKLSVFSVSKNAEYAAYGISKGGSDWQTYYVMDVAKVKKLDDELKWIKVSEIAWHGKGFYYSRYDEPKKGHELSSKNEDHKVYFHKIGTPQSEDILIYQNPENPGQFNTIETSEDEKYMFLYISDRGKGKKGNALFYMDLINNNNKFIPVAGEVGEDNYYFIHNIKNKFLIRTNRNAPNQKIILFDTNKPMEKFQKDIIKEKKEPLVGAVTAGNKIFTIYLKDVASEVLMFDINGNFEREIKLPCPGTATGFIGSNNSNITFYSFTSYNIPTTIYKLDIISGNTSVYNAPEIKDYDPSGYSVDEIFYKSKDQTEIPLFLVYKKGLKLNGKNPVLLYGYGGFNVIIEPAFNPLRIALLEQGMVFAVANIRGGGEYGENWHEAGTKLKKQNVFDDFISASEYLINKKYTSPDHLAVIGGSNGGLLVGAVINQRPELFKAAVSQVGVMDMLRFHKFTIGWNWIADYGSSDNEKEFKYIYGYSPIHNIKDNINYPAVLITTADHDDRVVPAHSFKYAATLQEKYKGDNPVLIRIDTKSGHGASNTKKTIDLTTDIFSFLFLNLGINPKY